jgi:hypothetical protein
MFGGKQQRSLRRTLFLTLVVVLSATTGLTPVFAGEEEPAGDTGAVSAAGVDEVRADDGGPWELGVHGSAADLPGATAAERSGMTFWLSGLPNWTVRYVYGEASAWEEDFKLHSLGGTNDYYIDSVDLQFYVGHGWHSGFTFANGTHDDPWLTYPDCAGAWGNNDNEWLALTSCQVLRASFDYVPSQGIYPDASIPNLNRWAACMDGQHLILGFVTNASAYNNTASTQAYHFGRYLFYNYSLPQAWYAACDVAQRGRVTRTIINELDCLNDRPQSGYVCADSYDSDWWYQTHYCGTETAIQVPVEQLQGQMPVLRLQPYSTDDANADEARLSNVLLGVDLSETVRAAKRDQNDPFRVRTNISRTLQLDERSGLYTYADISQLWSAEQAEQALAVNAASANYIDQNNARTIADNFLRSNQLFDPGSVFNQVISDTMSSQLQHTVVPTGPLGVASIEQVDETALVWQVIYSRRVTANVVTAAGVQQVEFSVVGNGAKQKVYVPVTGEVNAAGVLQTDPIGVQGGWRELQEIGAAGADLVMVDILSEEQVRALYLAAPDRVALNDLPLEVTNREILSSTVAYWEDAPGIPQAELVPVYELLVRFTDANSGTTIDDYVYVPASPLYARPYAEITSVTPGATNDGKPLINLTAADASKTLKELGVADFDFALGTGADGLYTYDWYLGPVSDNVHIGTGRTIQYQLPAYPDKEHPLVITLQVINTDSPNTQASVTTTTVQQSVLLPLVDIGD